jgi:large subunit ribosomal protein L18
MALLKQERRQRRKIGIRKRVIGSADRPRLTVYRSLKYIYAQLIDDIAGKTVASANSVKSDKGASKDAAVEVGKKIAAEAKAAGISTAAFDRNGFRYHGRIKALADAAREAGLKF